MKFSIGAMTVGDILDRGLKMLLSNLAAFYVINLIVLAPMILILMATPAMLALIESTGSPLTQAAPVLGGWLIAFLLIIVLQPIGTAAILHMISQEFIDQPVNMGSALRFALRRFGSLLGTSILVGLVLFAGFIMCFVPGIIFLVWYIFYAQIVVVEGRSGWDALKRSKELTEGFRWRIFGVLILVSLIGSIFGFVAAQLELFLPSFDRIPVQKMNQFDPGVKLVPIYPNYLINILVGQLVNILAQTYQAICITLLYFDLRNRKEGFDLEMAALEQKPQLNAEFP